MSIVVRPKLNSPRGEHYGVLCECCDGTEFVVQMTRPYGIQQTTFDRFADGYDVEFEKPLTGRTAIRRAWRRMERIIRSNPTYHLTKRNCEQFARAVIEGEAWSGQIEDARDTVKRWVIVAGATLFIGALLQS